MPSLQPVSLQAAITAYKQAVRIDPSAADIWGKLARIQAYASNSLTTDEQRRIQLQEALNSANKAVELAPEDSTAHAILAFVLDWNASPVYVGDEATKIFDRCGTGGRSRADARQHQYPGACLLCRDPDRPAET